MPYYYCRVGSMMNYYFEDAGTVIGLPNYKLEFFGTSSRLCYIPEKGSIFMELLVGTPRLMKASDVIYKMENLLFPVEDCTIVTKEHRFYNQLTQGFGI